MENADTNGLAKMTRRRYLTPRAKVDLWTEQGGRCAECRTATAFSRMQWDHVLALCLTGTNDAHNWQGLCAPCHTAKTRGEAGKRAKADRCKAYHEGKKKRRGRAMQSRGWDTRLRRRVDGRVEVRT